MEPPLETDTAPPSLLSLPAAALRQIAQLSTRTCGPVLWFTARHGHPLLPVNRGCRDTVLSSIHSITLISCCDSSPAEDPLHTLSPAPCARLLHLACCQATPGLTVRLRMSEADREVLPELLQPGIDGGGWDKVHSLQVCCPGVHHFAHSVIGIHSAKLCSCGTHCMGTMCTDHQHSSSKADDHRM
jgi:hypothetical protein